MAATLRARLLRRLKGCRGVFITLTYRREEWVSPLELYRDASESQHVAMFIRRLQRALGTKLTGRWFCKLEFQSGGWVHWHLIIDGVKFIPHDELERLWGFGFVWIKPASPRNIAYCAKYLAKDGALPAFVLADRARALKVVRVSPGFWREPAQSQPDRPERMKLNAYECVGQRLERWRDQWQARDDRGCWASGAGLLSLLVSLSSLGAVASAGRWIVYPCTMGYLRARASAAQAAAPGVNLIDTGVPDSVNFPPWLSAVLADAYGVDLGGA